MTLEALTKYVSPGGPAETPCPGEYHHLTTEGPPCCLAYVTRAPIPDCGGTGLKAQAVKP